MIEIKTLEIAGFASTLQDLRLPFGLTARSGTNFWERWYSPDEENKYGNFRSSANCDINAKDLVLMKTLIKRGDEHAKAIRGIIVYAEINAPRYWWSEADTYRAGTERLSSESTMHINGKGLSTEELVAMKEALPEGTMQKRIQSNTSLIKPCDESTHSAKITAFLIGISSASGSRLCRLRMN